ncbi:Cilia- and flagella-associated protein 70 [Phlyctochytrium bullatum]|nr:Cilia- and flagella-associated protein 70 [Phlyctochytrium bullatum]
MMITKSVSDFIPRRIIPDDMVFEKRSHKANEDYRIQIQEIVRCLVMEYQGALSSNLFAIPESSALEEMPFIQSRSSQEEQMMFNDKDSAFSDPTLSKTADFSTLKKFAEEAEEDNNINVAMSYHQERIAKYEDSFQAWFDYGTFCMRNGMQPKGIECFKEVLARNAKHIPRLGLYYDAVGEETESEKYLTEAVKAQKAEPASESVFVSAAKFLINCHAGQLAERALAQELLLAGPSVQPYLLLSKLEMQRANPTAAFQHLRDALDVRQDDPNVWTYLAHIHYTTKQWNDAQSAYETVLSLPEEAEDALSVSQSGTFEATQAIMQAVRVGVKDIDLLKNVAVALYHLGQVSPAAECLRLALEEDPSDVAAQELFTKAITKGSRDFLNLKPQDHTQFDQDSFGTQDVKESVARAIEKEEALLELS